jgi:hypothetical protein
VKVRLLGRIFPTVFKITIDNYPSLTFPATKDNLELTFNVEIRDGIITVDCTTNKWSKAEHLMPIYMRATDIVRAAVDLVAFSTGNGLTVILDTLIDPAGNRSVIAPQNPELALLSTSLHSRVDGFEKLLGLMLPNFTLIHALRDLIDAVTQIHVSPRACGRVVDGLRQIVAPNDEPKKGWRKLREVLRIDREYLQMITDHATGPRHADPTHIPGPITTELTKRTWTIMDRYFEFLLRGGKEPLPPAEFPLLIE